MTYGSHKQILKLWTLLYLNEMASVEMARRILWMVLLGCLAISHLICLGNQTMSKKCDKREKPQYLLQRLIMCTVASVLASAWVYKIIETRPTVPLDKLHHGERGIWQHLYWAAHTIFFLRRQGSSSQETSKNPRGCPMSSLQIIMI